MLRRGKAETTTSLLSIVNSEHLPFFESYQAQLLCREPFICQDCKPRSKKLAPALLATHTKAKHNNSNCNVACVICKEAFSKQKSALEHLAAYHQVYDCPKCQEKFSEFDWLQSHLKSAHNKADWPWICGFCDQVLLYDLEFRIHVQGHTEKPPYTCPSCSRRGFNNSERLRQHLAKEHLPRGVDASGELINMTRDNNKKTGEKKAVEAAAAAAAAAAADENAVNREIAALLLNLHASRSATDLAPGGAAAHVSPSVSTVHVVPKAEDLSLKAEMAIDLSKAKCETPLPATISAHLAATPQLAMNGGVDLTKTTAASSSSSSSAYNFYPSLAAMAGLSPSSLTQMNSNYLLQNLLLGKMQQMASSASSASTTNSPSSMSTSSSSSLSFPTQPLPAQVLSVPSSKAPTAVLSSKTIPTTSSQLTLNVPSAALLSSGSVSLPTMPNPMGSPDSSMAAGNIPLLCGQIVAQLNGLLFLVHSLNCPQIEINLQTQLGAIFGRLQEIVSMVEQAKQQQEASGVTVTSASSSKDKELARQLEKMKETKMKEEEKIAKHIQDYQRALLQQHEQQAALQIAPLKETAASNNVVNMLKKQAQANLEAKDEAAEILSGMPEVESTSGLSAAARRRRGRPPKNSNMDLSYSPPDAKRSRAEMEVAGTMLPVPASMNGVLPDGTPTASSTTKANGGGNSKGIRNRVFCGECGGCLKNDDCGRCRYCQDKTKFGGQNRLRQKCLHRRCQMDTHRKRNSNNANNAAAAAAAAATAAANLMNGGASNGVVVSPNGLRVPLVSMHTETRRSPSPTSIYSGVDLARLAATAAKVAAEQQLQEQQQQQFQLANSRAAAANGQAVVVADNDSDGSSSRTMDNAARMLNRKTRSRQKSTASSISCTRKSVDSDDDDADHKAQKSSRIDKWKAKHEAMLKEAKRGQEGEGKEAGHVIEDEEDEEMQNKSSGDGSEAEEEEQGANVCIEFERKNMTKPHTRHNSVTQQVLSV